MSGERVRRTRSHRVAASLLGLLVATCVASGAWSQTQPGPPATAAPTTAGTIAAPPATGTAAPTTSASAVTTAMPMPSVTTSATSDTTAPAPTFTGIRRKVQAPPPPPPTPAQVAALAELEKEAEAFRQYATDYRGAMTRIIQNHYEERRRRVIDALDKEINVELLGLKDARAEAIRRLEQFIERYSGRKAHPESTPTAMFRLAALYEERARDEGDLSEDLAVTLLPAIALYKRIIREFPQYKELSGVYYYLGHALHDSARFPEAQQVFRSMVCHNKYPYPVEPDPKNPAKDTIGALPQDHDRAYWRAWEGRHPEPIGLMRSRQGSNMDPEDTVYVNPYPDNCEPLQKSPVLSEGTEPRYLAEVWWLIGDYHFNELDDAAGPYTFNRAESAYKRAIQFKNPPVYGVAMYKLAWTFFKQQRYETSVRQFVELLKYADEQEKKTGDTGADFRTEAYTYVAGALTYLDFTGPAADEPFVPRSDVLDLEKDVRVAEQKMRIAIERVQNPSLIPQDRKWTVEIYKALAAEFKELNQFRNLIEISEMVLKRWPMDRDAPVLQAQIADIYDMLASRAREGTAEKSENAKRALDARTKLAAYVGNTPWVIANRDDPEAIQAAEKLVRGGLRRAAADHTNGGSALLNLARETSDDQMRTKHLERALSEYRMAATGWQGVLGEDDNAPDAYESRYWLADATHNIIVIQVELDKSPAPDDYEAARRAAVDVRDSNEDDKYLQPAAFMVVDTAQQMLLDQYRQHKRSSGSQGIEMRTGLNVVMENDQPKVNEEEIPKAVQGAISARDEYIQRVPPTSDLTTKDTQTGAEQKNSELYAYQSAEFFFLYGHFKEAQKRFEPIYAEQCGKSPFGYLAWEKLTTMANLMNDIPRSRALAEAAQIKSCAIGEEQKLKEKGISQPTISRGYYIDAAAKFEKAEKMPDGPERVQAWREAAALYRVALEKAPARDEAPEAAINGAYCYKQVGEYDQAIEMYTLFIKEYGNDERMTKLDKGDPNGKPPLPPQPKKLAERVKYLKQAYDALSASYVLFFNYRAAAETYDTISRNGRFEQPARRTAAKNAVLLYSNVGERERMVASRGKFLELDPPAEQKAEIDWLVASADLKVWDERGIDDGANKAARLKAIASMEEYFTANRNNGAATAYLVQAAYHTAKLYRAGNDPKAADWCRTTTSAFDKFRTFVPSGQKALGSPQADMAAECAYTAVDEKLKQTWDYDTNHHRYQGVIDKVIKEYNDDLKKAGDSFFNDLQSVVTSYESRAQSVTAFARQGSLYDSCRSGLYNTRPPGLKLYTDREEKLLKLAETSDREDLQETADAIRQRRREQWRSARERLLNDADRAMIKFYVQAVVYSRAWNVRTPEVDRANQRLAFFTDILGDAKMRELAQGVIDPETKQPFVYEDGFFLRTRPGMSPLLVPDTLPVPLPVGSQ